MFNDVTEYVSRRSAVIELVELLVNHDAWDYEDALFKVACMESKTINAYLEDYQSGSGVIQQIG